MFTFDNLFFLFLNYKHAKQSEVKLNRLVPSMLLGAKKGVRADSVFKAVERSLKGPDEPAQEPDKFWEEYFSSYSTQSLMNYLGEKLNWTRADIGIVLDMMDQLAATDGYFWCAGGDASADISKYRCISHALRFLIVIGENQHETNLDWPNLRRQMGVALDDVEQLEEMSASIFSGLGRTTDADLIRFLNAHPLGETSAGKQIQTVLDQGVEVFDGVEQDWMAELALKMAMTGVLWQFALMHFFLIPRDIRMKQTMYFPYEIDGSPRSASSQWLAMFIEFVEQGPLSYLGEWPREKGRGKPSKVSHVAKFLFEHFEDGRSYNSLSEKLGGILNGKAALSFRLVEALRVDVLSSINQRIDETQALKFAKEVNCLVLNGHVAGFADYVNRVAKTASKDKGMPYLENVFSSVWSDWPTINQQAASFLRVEGEASERN